MPNEIELKLEISVSGIASVTDAGLFGEIAKEAALNATYFDTSKHELRGLGHSLRIRKGDGMALQTIKSGEVAAGLFSRGEWELPVVGCRPVPDGRTPVSDLLTNRLDELVPLFDVATRRRLYRLKDGLTDIEVALDRVEVSAGERKSQFCELELELLAGKPATLFDLARRIDAVTPVRVGVQSKAERGYRLLETLPAAHRAERLPLDPTTDLPTAFAAIASSCLKQYRLNEAILLDRYVPEAVHQARIGLRRLRSAMVLFREMVGGTNRDRLNAQLRELARCLGEARDFDVLAAQAGAGPVLERLNHAREAAHSAMNRRLKSKATRMLLLDLSEWIADGYWRRDPRTAALRAAPLCEFAAGALDRLRRKTDKHGRRFVALPPEARHRVRKDTKKLRYGVEFLAPLFKREAKRKKFIKALEALQGDLGELNDRAAAGERLVSLGLVGTPEAERFLARWETANLLEKAAENRKMLLSIKPFWR